MKRHNYNIAIAITISCILFFINGYHNYIKDKRKDNLEKYKAGYYDNVTVKNKNIEPSTTKSYVPPKNWTKYIIGIYNRLLLNILYVINQKYGLNL